ncbi:hypothetical protein A3F86_02760 [candidate division WOR-1 bacterium RIFCSPLOWO2_12_FULL_45_9]|uniref:Integrase catalytic domain-containing protein n=1 Tax=candidate division WOR-1 bacterium RIFCSPLOWO2_12_FULL_45_9 TaxID=1802568 RepID=A0A1F4RMA9_UNCSA|nr:MAG: hypothetical protein A3F86_02760 [candidate division WOR-1 bacterium RIFCSPLOWO2_12_FULL_45_9]
MEIKFKMEYFKSIYDRYQHASRPLKEKILDEFCKVCKYHRKYAIHKLNGPPLEDRCQALRLAGIKRRRPKIYSQQAINILMKVWEAAGYVCGVRLKALLPLWLPWIEKHFCLTPELKKQLLKISARQIDRRLKPYKFKDKKCLYGGTKPGSLLKHHIPIKTNHWDVKTPGFTEVDTVSHSGNNADGLFAYSVNQTDILTGWVETRAVLGKGENGIIASLEEMEGDFPFSILGIDSDNGSEFINHPLYKRCQQKNIQFTRGRPYKKDDNAHIEQKNWTHVRKLMGWNRYDTLTSVNAMNDLYKNELRLFMNLFLPSMKLIVKERVGSRRKRKYDDPKTPLDRVIESDKGQPHKIEQLKTLRKQLDPFRLSAAIEKKLEAIAKKANHRQSPKSIPAAETGQNSELNCIEASVMREISQILSLEVQYA